MLLNQNNHRGEFKAHSEYVQQRTCTQLCPKLAHYYADLYSNIKAQLVLEFTLILLLLTFLKEFINNFTLFNLRFYLSIHEIQRDAQESYLSQRSARSQAVIKQLGIFEIILALMLAMSVLKC